MIILTPKTKSINSSIHLPYSKSETNRALIINALSNGAVKINNTSDCSDSLVLLHNLNKINLYQKAGDLNNYLDLNVGACGTAMRFLTSYLSIQKGKYRLKGDARMHNRPISTLVDTLKALGANIHYIDKPMFPPLEIIGVESLEQRCNITIDASISSQYISSLLLIAPYIKNGIKINLPRFITSKPYVEMTLDMMTKAGIRYSLLGNFLEIKKQNYTEAELYINADWSSASYWYAIASLSNQATITINNINVKSKQADIAIVSIMRKIGVNTLSFDDSTIQIIKTQKLLQYNNQILDFTNYPDLAQTIIPIFTILGYKIKYKGLHTLRFKETNRIEALQKELQKINYILTDMVYGRDKIYYSYKKTPYLYELFNKEIIIDTYKDHRMAMAFAPLALKLGELRIKDPEVINKSYPNFWQDLKQIFTVK